VNVLIIARLTLLEALRRRLLWALGVLTITVVALTAWGFALLVANARERAVPSLELVVAVSQLLILVAFMFSFVLAMTAAFLGAPAIAADLESGVLQAVAARPIRRAEILLG
jgi:ABC-type transport system involved in multi-copper enzyme maturation permease subunit